MTPQIKRITIIAVSGLLILLLIFTFVGLRQRNMGTIVIESAPTQLTLKIDGKTIANSGKINVSPGDHTLEASMEGFETQTIPFFIEANDEKNFYIALQPNSELGESYLTQNPEEAFLIEGLVGQSFTQASQEATTANPIIADLPVFDTTFSIDYKGSQNATEIIVVIKTVDQQGRDDALNWMRTFGYNPDDYTLEYINPLEE